MPLEVCWSNCTGSWNLSELTSLLNFTGNFSVLESIRGAVVSLAVPVTWLELRAHLETVILKHYHYLPLTPLVLWLYPLLVTLVILPIVSASTWFFWIITSLTLGALQLVYVMYQFAMIGLDLAVLSVLKTFALIRSWVLSTYHFASTHSHNKHGQRRPFRGRKRQWRDYLATAKQYADFERMEILEPAADPTRRVVSKPDTHPSLAQYRQRILRHKYTRTLSSFLLAPIRITALCVRSIMQIKQIPNKENTEHKPRRTKSCMDIFWNPLMSLDTSSDTAASYKTCRTSPPTHDLTRSTSFSSPTWIRNNQHTLDQELGMVATMLSTTTQRLQEARLQYQQLMLVQETPRGMATNNTKSDSCLETIQHAFLNIPLFDKKSPDHDMYIQKQSSEHPPSNQTQQSTSSTLPDLSVLKYLLTGIVKRNHLNVESILVDNAQLVTEYGRHRISKDSRDLIQSYYHEVQSCLDFIADSDIVSKDSSHLSSLKDEDDTSMLVSEQHVELYDRVHLMRKMRHNVGRTALMLSGGGAQAMYHLGTIKALCESGLYDDITVISGTSGGSITAAMCAIKTRDELLKDVCVTHVSTDYLLNGEMKKHNIRWFPKVVDMGMFWLQHGLLVDSKEFKRCCDFYFSDITFEEAFLRTGKHVCITVSASRAGDNGSSSGDGSQRLLLNHISTPHVTIASAVACSCALPGVMAPGKLITKNSNSEQEFFEVDGVEWIDGSVQADLPFKRISTLFNVSNYIVCQTNFHVVPFLHKPHHPSTKSWYWRVFQLCEWDIRSRALNLSRLGLFPKIFGQDISKVFKQKYHGDLTIVPRFTTMQVFGLKALVNPTLDDMEVYIQNGQAATWPYISVIREMLRLETTIERCINRLTDRIRSISPDQVYMNDDVESVTSADGASFSLASSSKAPTRHLSLVQKEIETLRTKVKTLEQENQDLRKRLDQLQQSL